MTDLIDPPEPGASARREAERLAASRERRGDPSEAPSARETAFRAGGEGEAYLGGRLNAAARRREGVGVLHDLVLPGRKANIDHVVVGPAGVTIIDCKAWSGPVWIGRHVIGQGGRGRRRPIEGMGEQLHRVQTILAAAGRDDVGVEPVLCFVKESRGLSGRPLRNVDGVRVGTVRHVIRHATRSGNLDPHDVNAIFELLAASFVVQGGAVPPAGPGTDPELPPPVRATSRRVRPSRRRVWMHPRRRRAIRHGLIDLALAAIGFAMLMALVHGLPNAVRATTPEMSQPQLELELPAVRSLARAYAHAAVRQVGVVMHRDRVVVRFRSGRRCRVAVTVPRRASDPLAGARVAGKHCAPDRR